MAIEVCNGMVIGAAAEWDRICEQVGPDAAKVAADLMNGLDSFAEELEEIVGDYWTVRSRGLIGHALSSNQERKHARMADVMRALQAIATASPASLTCIEQVIRSAILEAFAERAQQIVEDRT